MRTLLVEDDTLLGRGIETALRQQGFAIDWARNCEQAQSFLSGAEYDLVVLDIMLPDGSGLSILRELRAKKNTVPVLILSARDSVSDRVGGLNLGADDYLTKPFALAELLARVQSLSRRQRGRSDSQITYRDLTIDTASREVKRGGRVVDLHSREYELLLLLLDHKGTALTRERIHESLYDWDHQISSNAIDVNVHLLRTKLGSNLIRTLRNVGYRIDKDEA
jgi:two-component system, OmpR family, response regulator QseB